MVLENSRVKALRSYLAAYGRSIMGSVDLLKYLFAN
jgi:hypothetical protein